MFPEVKGSDYRKDIDGLRGLAIALVIVFHAFGNVLPSGFIGVDVFFVISGYLITRIILQQLNDKNFCLKGFYRQRILRIFPALSVVLIACLVFGWLALLPQEYAQLGRHVVGGVSFVINIMLGNETGYFENSSETKPLLNLWSLGVEEQFYILWPAIILLAYRLKKIGWAIALVVSLSFVYNIYFSKIAPVQNFFFPMGRLWELACGGMLAYLMLNTRYEFKRQGKLLVECVSIAGFLLLTLSLALISDNKTYPGFIGIIPVIGTVLVIASGPNAYLNEKILSNRFVVYVGLISYPLYLWHWPILSFLRIVDEKPPGLAAVCLALVLSFVLSVITYKFVEKPIRFGSNKNIRSLQLVVAFLLIGFAGFYINNQSGLAGRFKNNDDLIELVNNPIPNIDGLDCYQNIPEFKNVVFDKDMNDCKLSTNESPNLLFIGDSHMRHYRSEIWNRFKDKTSLFVVDTACFPLPTSNDISDDCLNKYKALVDYVNRTKSIEYIVLSGYWSARISGGFERSSEYIGTDIGWRIAKQVSVDADARFQKNSRIFLDDLFATNRNLIFMKDIPDLDFNVASCYDVRPLRIFSRDRTISECVIDENTFVSRIKSADQSFESALNRYDNIYVFDPRPIFCKGSECVVTDGRLPYYMNGDHLNRYGASLVIDSLANYIESIDTKR